MNVEIKVLQPFRDLTNDQKRLKGEVFVVDEARARYLKSRELVEVLGKVKPDIKKLAEEIEKEVGDVSKPKKKGKTKSKSIKKKTIKK